MSAQRRSRRLFPSLDMLESYCLLSRTGPAAALAHAVEPIVLQQSDQGQISHSRLASPDVASVGMLSGQIHAATTYTKGPVTSPGTYASRFDDRIRFFYSTASTFSKTSLNNAALKLVAKPLNGTSTHRTGNFYVTPSQGKSFLVVWNNVTANRYDWLAVKYLGSGRFATLDRFGKSTNINNSQVQFVRTYPTGGSTITIQFTNPTGSWTFANTFTYSISIRHM